MASPVAVSSSTRIPRRRRRALLAKRERRDAERAFRRAEAKLLHFVTLWVDDAFENLPFREFTRMHERVVLRYRDAKRAVLRARSEESCFLDEIVGHYTPILPPTP
jgi:hypothetical protein